MLTNKLILLVLLITILRKGKKKSPMMSIKLSANKFDRIRIEKGIESRAAVGELVGFSPPQLSNLLSNRYSPTLRTIAKFCRVLDCRPDDLFEYVR